MEEVLLEQQLLEIPEVKIEFNPILYISKGMETYEGEY